MQTYDAHANVNVNTLIPSPILFIIIEIPPRHQFVGLQHTATFINGQLKSEMRVGRRSVNEHGLVGTRLRWPAFCRNAGVGRATVCLPVWEEPLCGFLITLRSCYTFKHQTKTPKTTYLVTLRSCCRFKHQKQQQSKPTLLVTLRNCCRFKHKRQIPYS